MRIILEAKGNRLRAVASQRPLFRGKEVLIRAIFLSFMIISRGRFDLSTSMVYKLKNKNKITTLNVSDVICEITMRINWHE